jgi:hypothetical protein
MLSHHTSRLLPSSQLFTSCYPAWKGVSATRRLKTARTSPAGDDPELLSGEVHLRADAVVLELRQFWDRDWKVVFVGWHVE